MSYDPCLDYQRHCPASPVGIAPGVLRAIRQPCSLHNAAISRDCTSLCIALTALALMVLGTPRAQAGFRAPVAFDAGSNPVSVAVGDFNGDGHPDLVVANHNSNNVSVLLSKGDGTFQTAVNYAVGSNPSSVAVGDFNRDGIPDLVVANQNNKSVSVLLGNGDGTFQAAANYNTGTHPTAVAVADLNGDGILDLAVVNNTASGNVSVLLGKGDGTFQSAVESGHDN